MAARIWFPLMVGLGLVGPAAGEDAVKDEQKKLEGTWVVELASLDGKRPEPTEKEQAAEYVFTADKVTVKMKGGDIVRVSYRIDPTKSPKTMDLVFAKEAKPDSTRDLFIYQLDGDTLKLCTSFKRPAAFSDKGQSLFVLKRKKG